VTQRRQLIDRLAGLGESGEIIRSMKNLAFMETRKLDRLIENQRRVVEQIDAVAADFLAFHPETLPAARPSYRVYLAIGSRRGFCGDFNERLAARLRRLLAETDATRAGVIAVGHKLCLRLEADVALEARLDGADVAEEIPSVMRAVVEQLDRQQERHGALALSVLYHRDAASGPEIQSLLPPFEAHRGEPPPQGFAALLNLAPRDFLLELGEQYLFAALHAVLFESLLAESERRVRHLDGAVRHLEDQVAALQRRVQTLRQEEIIEEIEVILLNAAQFDESGPGPERAP
jgi:F-type H+-transporting ATPase subunit gamma